MIDIVDWEDIADGFSDTLLLGNGASMAVDTCFGYESLLGEAEDAGLITADVATIFKYLNNTKDFELVMRMVRHAYHVNQALGIDEKHTTQAYRDIREALVASVRSVHPSYDDVVTNLPAMHRFMRRFDTILSLNYDLLVYWAMMEGNRTYGNWFKDCFVNGLFEDDWERLREPWQAVGSTLVFYPHGNLALASDLNGVETKIALQSESGTLLGRVLKEWESGERLPLFVSEGDSDQKHAAILRSGYLSTVYNSVLPELGETFVVYGCSFDVDDHILRRVCKPTTRRVAVSVHTEGQSKLDLKHHCNQIEWQLKRLKRNLGVSFFDAQSQGCWLGA